MDGKVLDYLHTLKIEDEGYLFSKYSNATLLSTSFGVMVDYLLTGQAGTDASELKDYYSNRLDNGKGQVILTGFDSSQLTGGHKADYVEMQLSYFSLIAADTLGVRLSGIDYVTNFLNDETKLEDWFYSLDLSQFWYESNKIMFILYFLFYQEKYGEGDLSARAGSLIPEFINLLNKNQDKNTGFWGTNLNNNDLYDGCFGAAHIYFFYDYLGAEIQYVNKIIDNTLLLHNEKGLLKSKYGGACEDYDAIDIYLRCLKQTDYRKQEIFDILGKMRSTIGKSQNPDGGFSYRITDSFLRKTVFSHILKREYSYSGWDRMKTLSFQPDLWATWFRALSLKVIDLILENRKDFYSYNLPAWGYINK
ncbi:hypothetical protein [Maribellus sp. YY47]|uniref:hypothetical protein n=1 Tax=Maribellus sp. YY47 TaxID=2929486 RepID=UPI0020015921|nr:hypothetical protein [Maribellus sp. YY47]MCK3683747.1 hypothetical protein [Maribellus sp. YY47]